MKIPGQITKILGRLEKVGFEVLEGVITYFVVQNATTGKKEIDVKKLRDQAPYFVKSLQDEAEFNGLVVQLDPGLQKGLERWMANLGDNQRADVILTIVQMIERPGLDRPDARKEAIKVLQELAAITPDVYKTRRAVAFRLMKPDENDYWGARLTDQGQQALTDLFEWWQESRTEFEAWLTQLDAGTTQIRTDRLARNQRTLWTKIPLSFVRAFGFRIR